MKRMIFLLLILLLTLMSAASCAEDAARAEITIPSLEIPAKEIPANEGLALIRDMKAGWNLGNGFDASDCFWLSDPMEYESAWCGAKASEALIEAVRAAGFRTIRVPVSWHNHVDADWKIDEAWLNRVTEVVSWAYRRGMYVIVNIHHDCDPGYYYPDSAHLENSARYVRTIWTQLAARFREYDEHLIFECVNEPRLKDTEYEWRWVEADPACQDAMACIMALNQVFVDTVRADGGNNAARFLMVPAYDASAEYACSELFTLPEDPAENRIIVSAHAYAPYDFALQDPGTDRWSLDSPTRKSEIARMLNRLYEKYVTKGIPVLMGEFGAMEKNGNLQDRVDWLSYYAASARAGGITCCWWDNNCFSGDGERFGLFDRTTGACAAPEMVEAFMKYCE